MAFCVSLGVRSPDARNPRLARNPRDPSFKEIKNIMQRKRKTTYSSCGVAREKDI